jgi:hypothetical protein
LSSSRFTVVVCRPRCSSSRRCSSSSARCRAWLATSGWRR